MGSNSAALSDDPSAHGARARIIEAALLLAANEGVAAVTHRKVSNLAGVSLGSVSYYFNGIDDLIYQAFETYVARAVSRYDNALLDTKSPEHLRDAILHQMLDRMLVNSNEIALMYELYAQAARKYEYKLLVRRWMSSTRRAMASVCGREGSIKVEAGVEGLLLQRFIGDDNLSRGQTASFVLSLIRMGAPDELEEHP